MTATPASLLDRLKAPRPAASDWRRLDDLYRPLVGRWLARVPGLGTDADDLAQEILVAVVKAVPGFDRQREGSFRAWLRAVTVNRTRQFWRDRARQVPPAGEEFLTHLEDPADPLAAEWDRAHDRHVLAKLLAAVEADFAPATWRAFRRFALGGEPAAAVAADLGMTENAVLVAKSRVLRRLREEAAGLVDAA